MGSRGFSFGSAFVDHDTNTFHVFGKPMNRCHPRSPPAGVPDETGVWVFSSADLVTWARAKTDVAWSGPNTDVARVRGVPPSLPPHRFVMVTEEGTFALNNNADGDLTRGWRTLSAAEASVPACPEGCQCPSIKFFSGWYYLITGGNRIWLLRSRDLKAWEQPPPALRPFVQSSAGDGAVAQIAGNAAPGGPIASADAWYAARHLTTPSVMLAHTAEWDHNVNDADFCCDSASGVAGAYVLYAPSTQGARPTGGLNGTGAYNAVAVANVTLDVLLESYFA